jgi:hypothetical protein
LFDIGEETIALDLVQFDSLVKLCVIFVIVLTGFRIGRNFD